MIRKRFFLFSVLASLPLLSNSGALAVLGLSRVAEAACIQTPTCSSLGYTSNSSCEGGTKCPFGNAWNCTVSETKTELTEKITELEKVIEELQTKIIVMNCKVGDILYSDMSCAENLYTDKTPIGVVFDATNGLAIAKDEFTDLAWGPIGDISGVQNYAHSSTGDWQGFNNTKAIYDYEKSNGSYYPAIEVVLIYSTTGTSQGQWYLPAAGELKAISDNKDALNATLSKIGGTKMSGSYWSSSEQDSNNAWRIILGGSFSNTGKGNRGTVKPIINFASNDKISVDLTKSTACKIGDILYSDKTCSASLISGKTPIGVVFNGENRLAVSLEPSASRMTWGVNGEDIPGIPNMSEAEARKDFNGKANTAAIKTYDSDLSDFPAAKYAYNYTTLGTKVGDWYLPAMGELYEIYQTNRTAINKTLSALGKSTVSFNDYWSSSEMSYGTVYSWISEWGVGIQVKDAYGNVRPVLAF